MTQRLARIRAPLALLAGAAAWTTLRAAGDAAPAGGGPRVDATRLPAPGSYTLDHSGRLTLIDFPHDTDVSLTYDAAGRKTGMTDGSGTTGWTFDNANRVTSVSQELLEIRDLDAISTYLTRQAQPVRVNGAPRLRAISPSGR